MSTYMTRGWRLLKGLKNDGIDAGFASIFEIWRVRHRLLTQGSCRNTMPIRLELNSGITTARNVGRLFCLMFPVPARGFSSSIRAVSLGMSVTRRSPKLSRKWCGRAIGLKIREFSTRFQPRRLGSRVWPGWIGSSAHLRQGLLHDWFLSVFSLTLSGSFSEQPS